MGNQKKHIQTKKKTFYKMFKNCIIAAAILLLSDTLVEARRRKNKGPDSLGYFASERYQSKTAEKKLDKLWK